MRTPYAVTVNNTHRVACGAAARRAASSLARLLHCGHSCGRAAQLANAVIILAMAIALVRCVLGTVCELCAAVLEACMPFAATVSHPLQLGASTSNGQQLLMDACIKIQDAV